MAKVYSCRLTATFKFVLALILCSYAIFFFAFRSKPSSHERMKKLQARTMREKYPIDCKMLLLGHINEQKKAQKLLSNLKTGEKINLLPDSNFMFRRSKCDLFREVRGYDKHKTIRLEYQFPLAFIILVDNNVEQFERFLRTIYRPHNVYCIHVDFESSKAVKDAIKSIADCFDNVFIPTKTEIVYYAHFSLLKAQLNCMSDLLNMEELISEGKHSNLARKKAINWKYVLNAASTFLPLRTNLELVRILNVYNESSDVGVLDDPRFWFRHKTRFEYNVFKGKNVDLGVPKKAPPYDFKIMKGSNYIAASKLFVDYVINSKYGKELIEWSRDMVFFYL